LVIAALAAFCSAEETDFIVGGKDADAISQYPWQVSMQMWGSHGCGGALIAKDWVVTAAHCVDGQRASALKIVAGIFEQSNPSGSQKRSIAKIYQNVDFPGGRMFMTSDVALLKLKAPFNLNDNVKVISMAEDGDDFEGQTCVLTGWGRYDRTTNDLSDRLQQLETRCISRELCQQGFKSYGWKVQDSHICFKQAGATACHGDSGGPAICKKDGEWTLAGVTSGGSPYCNKGMPNIYTRISAFRDWIEEQSGL